MEIGAIIAVGIIIVAVFIYMSIQNQAEKDNRIEAVFLSKDIQELKTSLQSIYDKDDYSFAIKKITDDSRVSIIKDILSEVFLDNYNDTILLELLKNKYKIDYLMEEHIKENKLFEKIKYINRFNALNTKLYYDSALTAIYYSIDHEMDTFDLKDCDKTIDSFEDENTLIQTINHTATIGSKEIENYILNNPSANILMGISYIKALYLEDEDVNKIISNLDEYLHENWNDYNSLIFIEKILPLKKVLPRDEYKDIRKQKAHLQIIQYQNQLQLEQINILQTLHNEQVTTNIKLETHNELQEQANWNQEESNLLLKQQNEVSRDANRLLKEQNKASKDTNKILKKAFSI